MEKYNYFKHIINFYEKNNNHKYTNNWFNYNNIYERVRILEEVRHQSFRYTSIYLHRNIDTCVFCVYYISSSTVKILPYRYIRYVMTSMTEYYYYYYSITHRLMMNK